MGLHERRNALADLINVLLREAIPTGQVWAHDLTQDSLDELTSRLRKLASRIDDLVPLAPDAVEAAAHDKECERLLAEHDARIEAEAVRDEAAE